MPGFLRFQLELRLDFEGFLELLAALRLQAGDAVDEGKVFVGTGLRVRGEAGVERALYVARSNLVIAVVVRPDPLVEHALSLEFREREFLHELALACAERERDGDRERAARQATHEPVPIPA